MSSFWFARRCWNNFGLDLDASVGGVLLLLAFLYGGAWGVLSLRGDSGVSRTLSGFDSISSSTNIMAGLFFRWVIHAILLVLLSSVSYKLMFGGDFL